MSEATSLAKSATIIAQTPGLGKRRPESVTSWGQAFFPPPGVSARLWAGPTAQDGPATDDQAHSVPDLVPSVIRSHVPLKVYVIWRGNPQSVSENSYQGLEA